MTRVGGVAAGALAAAAAAALAAVLVVAGCGPKEAVGPSSSSSSPSSPSSSSSSGASPGPPSPVVPKRCGAPGARRALGTGVEVAVGEVAAGAAVAALSPAGGAAGAVADLGEHDDEGGDEHGRPVEPPDKTAAPATGAPALVKTQILLGMPALGDRLPRALVPVAETSLSPRALSVQRHPVGVALAWIEPPGLMLLRAGTDGLPVGEPRLIARATTRYALVWNDGAGSFALVAADADGIFGAALGPDGAARGEPERFPDGTDLDGVAAGAAGAVRPAPAVLAALLPPGVGPGDPPAAAAVIGGGAVAIAVAFAWRDARTGALSAAVADCR
ncbi:MAG TPA: hypothetical protein VG389_09800 [Myxococcota bacterium]|nr:hypothetical protein [Myxococcota bacterium]